MKGHGGRRNEAAAKNGRQVGAPPKSATIKAGAPLMLSQFWPSDGGYADLGKGKARIERIGSSRVVVVPLADGSEIRILIV